MDGPVETAFLPALRGRLRLAETLADWEDGGERVAEAERLLERIRGLALRYALMMLFGAGLGFYLAVRVFGSTKRTVLIAGINLGVYLVALGVFALGIAAVLAWQCAAIGRRSGGGGGLLRVVRAFVGVSIVPLLGLVASAVLFMWLFYMGWMPLLLALILAGGLVGLLVGPAVTVFAVLRYGDVYAEADARAPLAD